MRVFRPKGFAFGLSLAAAALSATQPAAGAAAEPFLAVGDEAGAGGGDYPKAAIRACKAGLPPYGMERLIDIGNLAQPKLVGGYGYSDHDCTVDNPRDAKLLACSGHQAGIRVFDIHDPTRPLEIAYFVGLAPPDPNETDPGSLLNSLQRVKPPINFAWSKGHSRFVWQNGQLHLWVVSSHGGFYTLKFEHQQEIANSKPMPTPGNEDYQD